eukprot:15351402-Ditylum_brightwellii.AAC.1
MLLWYTLVTVPSVHPHHTLEPIRKQGSGEGVQDVEFLVFIGDNYSSKSIDSVSLVDVNIV